MAENEQVMSIAVDRGFILVNGRRTVLDSLWRNGTAAQAYWLWREHFYVGGHLPVDG